VRGAGRVGAIVLGVLGFCGSASAVSAASSAPRWFYCGQAVPKNTGAFADKACSVASSPSGTGRYELLAGVGKGKDVKVKGGKGLEFELVTTLPPVRCNPRGKECVERCPLVEAGEKCQVVLGCKVMKGSGRPVAPGGLADVVLSFSKCEVLGSPCQSGAAAGVITTEPLAGQLGSLEGSRVGIDLANETEPGVGTIARYTCTEIGIFTVVGSVIAQQTGDTEGVSKDLAWKWTIGPYLGKVKECPECGFDYTPLVNTPSFVEGPDDYLTTQIEKEGELYGEFPSGLIGEATGKGEALEARE
jgi:hypothetical protein